MSKQFNFVMDAEDEEHFFAFVLEKGVIYETDHYEPIDQLPEKYSSKGWFMLYLSEKKNLENFLGRKSQGSSEVNVLYEPVIEWTRTNVGDYKNGITLGRLWLEMNYYDVAGNQIKKDESLNQWYKELVKWIKKNLTYYQKVSDGINYKYYVSSSLIPLLDKGYKLY